MLRLLVAVLLLYSVAASHVSAAVITIDGVIAGDPSGSSVSFELDYRSDGTFTIISGPMSFAPTSIGFYKFLNGNLDISLIERTPVQKPPGVGSSDGDREVWTALWVSIPTSLTGKAAIDPLAAFSNGTASPLAAFARTVWVLPCCCPNGTCDWYIESDDHHSFEITAVTPLPAGVMLPASGLVGLTALAATRQREREGAAAI